MEDSLNQMKQLYTFTGYTLVDAIRKFKEVLPPDAYTEVKYSQTGKSLTDISPAYLLELVTKVFGPIGIGWYYDYDPDKVTLELVSRPSKNDPGRMQWNAHIKYLTVRYLYYEEGKDGQPGRPYVSEPIISNGHSENVAEGYALRGAITNAIGAAFQKLLFQLDVYKGTLDHNNATKRYKAQQERKKAERDAAKANGTKVEEEDEEEVINEETAIDNASAQEEDVVDEEPVDDVPVKEEPKEETAEEETEQKDNASDNSDDKLAKAHAYVVPGDLGIPMAGKTLKEVVEDESYGEFIIMWLAQKIANLTGVMFEPKNKDETRLAAAANYLAEHYGYPSKKKK